MSSATEVAAQDVELRQRWIGTLAKARPAELEEAWKGFAPQPRYQFLRNPEIGLVMMRGRMGGDGKPFNVGEITVTRCSVRLDGGPVGHAIVTGRSMRHAELAAVFDAVMQDGDRQAACRAAVIAPLAQRQLERRSDTARKAAATKVEFFTLARGSD